jgi:hypothetical protein
MNNSYIIRILNESALQAKHSFDMDELRFVEANNRTYEPGEFNEFKRDLLEAGSKIRLLFMEYAMDSTAFKKFLENERSQILFFHSIEGQLTPALYSGPNSPDIRSISEYRTNTLSFSDITDESLYKNQQGEVIFFVIFPYQSLISEYSYGDDFKGEKLSPVRRFYRLLSTGCFNKRRSPDRTGESRGAPSATGFYQGLY